jgi:hypothetical protein
VLKPVPEMVTTVPTGPEVGEKELIVCAYKPAANSIATYSNTTPLLKVTLFIAMIRHLKTYSEFNRDQARKY